MASQPPSSSPLYGYGEAPTPSWLTPAMPQLPATSFGENFSASVEEMEIAGNIGSRDRYLAEGYRPLLDALTQAGEHWGGTVGGERGYARSGQYAYVNPYNSPGMGFNGIPDRTRMREMIFEAVRRRRQQDRNFLPGVPDTVDAFEAQITARNAARLQQLRNIQSRATGFGQIGGFLGGMAGSLQDPVNIATLPVGGGARTVVGSIARVTIENAAIEALMQPTVAQNYRALGEDYGLGDEIRSVLFSGLAAGGFHAGAHAAGRAYDALLPRIFDALPEHVQRRWAGAATIDQMPLTDILRATVPQEAWTPDLRAAVHVVDRESEIAEASPFVRTPAGDQAHADGLTSALHALIDGARPIEAGPLIPRGTEVPAPTPEAAVSSPGAAADFKARVRRRESGGNDRISNPQPGQTASGRYQFTHDTFVRLHQQVFGGNLSAEERWSQRFDGNVQERLMDAAIGSYQRVLRRSGQAITPGNLYLSHFFGPDDAVNILRHPDTPLADILRMTHSAGYVDQVFRVNPNLRRNMRGADAAALTNRAMGGRAPERMADAEPAPVTGGGSADALDLEAQLALRDSAEPIPEGHAADVSSFDAPPVLRRDAFDNEMEWQRAQADIDRRFGVASNFPEITPAPMGRGPRSLIDFISDRGGIVDVGGDLRAMGFANVRGVARAGERKLIRAADDLGRHSADDTALAAWEAGYFPNHPERPTVRELYDAMAQDYAGRRVYTPADAADVAAREALHKKHFEHDELIQRLEARAEERGHELDTQTLEDALDRRLSGLDDDEAVRLAMQAAAFRDAERAAMETGDNFYAMDDGGRRWDDGINWHDPASDGGPEASSGRRSGRSARFSSDTALGSTLGAQSGPVDRGAESLKRFDAPEGEGARSAAESIHHDLKAAIAENPALAAQRFLIDETGEEMTLDAILSELDGDRTAAAALRGCL